MTTKHKFQAETRRLLDLMIHSVYSNKEIFIRELISNASDAIDKLQFQSIAKPELKNDGYEPTIRLERDTQNRVLVIEDNGIGMNEAELLENLGTIAKSGTREMLKAMSNEQAENLIGQFGVGFYSSFMVADEVSVVTRKAGTDKAFCWTSTGDGTFSIEPADKPTFGTRIELKLKPIDQDSGINDFLDEFEIKGLIKKHSDFISYPIKMDVEKTLPAETEKDPSKPESKDEAKKAEEKPQKVIETEILNSMKPIWSRAKSEVKNEEYEDFYKHLSSDWNKPALTILYKAEGKIEFTSLLYIPEKAPFNMMMVGQDENNGLQLYVRRVLINDQVEELLPRYLRFVKGIVECNDLPLNLSREILQKDRHILTIKKNLTTKLLSELSKLLAKERDKYLEFYKEFSNILKEGISLDYENKDKITDMLLFSTSSQEKPATLKEIVAKMHPDQKEILFLLGETRDILANSPHYESYKEKNYEVIFLTEPVDEIVLQNVAEYDKKKIRSIAKEAPTDPKEGESKKEVPPEWKDLTEKLQKILEEDVREVRISEELISSPARLLGGEFDMSSHLTRILSKNGEKVPKTKRVLELNPNAKIIQSMKQKIADGQTIENESKVLLGYAAIADGGIPADPVAFNNALVSILEK